MKRLSFIALCILLISFIYIGCKKNNDLNPTGSSDNSSGTNDNAAGYNQSDTVINLRNGKLTLEIPSGSMKEGTQVSISSSDAAFADTASALHQFRLLPEGAQFKKPVTLTFHYDSSWLKGNSPWNIGIAFKNDADGKWYPAVNGSVDTVAHTISIKTTHFSDWCIYSCFHLYMKADEQLSEDYSQIIRMQPDDIGLLMLTMDEPPAWKSDPDKGKEFGNPLVASLTTPPIDPKEPYNKSLTPDEWDVNGIPNGDEHVGKILPVSGAQEKLYQYLAPSQPPVNQPVGISALIKTKNHGEILLIQPVEILGKWKLKVRDSTVIAVPGSEIIFGYHYNVSFHINKQDQIIYDGEYHSPIKFYKFTGPDITSWNIICPNYLKVNNITGQYNIKNNLLDCKLDIASFHGTTTIKLCTADGCASQTNDGSQYDSHGGSVDLTLKYKSGDTFKRDTTFGSGSAKVHIFEAFTLVRVSK